MEGMASSSVMNSSNSAASCQSRSMKAAKPQEQLNCPRCNSTNTKFCYYNNYSLSQPRYFCKTCRRYWTEGGSLRNVPVGGGSRKNKRSSSLSSSSSSIAAAATATAASASSFKLPDLNPPSLSQFSSIQNPNKAQIVNDHTSSRDLNLSFPGLQDSNQAMDLLTSNGIASRGWIGSFIPTLMPADSNAVLYSSSGLPEFKPASNLSFSIDHGLQDNNNNNGAKILFPFGDIKHDHHRDQFPSSNNPNNVHDHQNHEGTTATSSSGNYWNAILDHGGSW